MGKAYTFDPNYDCAFVPVVLVSEANQREHWRKRNDRKKEQQRVTALMLGPHRARIRAKRIKRICLVRVGGRTMDSDNHAGAFKHVQDAVAKFVGIDDGKLTWEYAHEKKARGEKRGVWVEFVFETKEEAT